MRKMKVKKVAALVAVFVVATFVSAGCANEEDAAAEIATCTTTAPTDSSNGVELCTVTGSVKHVKITGLQVTGSFQSASMTFGFDSFPGSGQSITTGAGQGRVLWYRHTSDSAPPTGISVEINEVSKSISNTGYTTGEQTVCFDILSGPSIRYWVNGVNGVDCSNSSTLTTANAVATATDFTGASTDLTTSGKIFFYRGASMTNSLSIELSNTNKGS